MKIVFLDAATLGDVSFRPIEELGELTCYDNSSPAEAMERVRDCDVMIVNKVKVTPELIDAAPHLRLICESATGVNNIDSGYAASKGIPVKNVAGYSTESVVQSTFMHILSLVGKLPYYDWKVKSGRYSWSGMFTDVSVPFFELAGKTMGIIGMGTIGRRVADVASAFGMKVIYYSTSGTSHCTDFPSVSLPQLMSGSDVVSVHAPLNEKTQGLVGAGELALMKPEAVIVNMGRGGIIDEAALAEAIDAGKIAGAGLDVYSEEPLKVSNPISKVKHQERLSLTPHTAWASTEARNRLVLKIAENIASL